MMRRPPRSTQSRSSAASDVYKRQSHHHSREFALASFSRRMRKYFSAGTRSMPLAYISQSSSYVTFECVSNVTTPTAYTSCTLRRDDLNFVSVSLPFRNSLILSLYPSLSSKTSLYSSSMSSSDDVIQSVGFMSENLTFQPQNHRCVTALKLCLHSSLFCRKEETRLVLFETRSL